MAISNQGHPRDAQTYRWRSLLTTDFCPSLNRYVYWLKEPIGWFALAGIASLLLAVYVSSVGWSLAAMIGAILLVGMAWPQAAVWAAVGSLRPLLNEVSEDDECVMVLRLHNRLPFPLLGIAIEGYFDRTGDETRPTLALAQVPAWSRAEYRIRVRPDLRGHYPLQQPLVTCAFPFGLWTARKPLADCQRLTVLPRHYPIEDQPAWSVGQRADNGDGDRVGETGETLGVRQFRSGDRLRNIHWSQTARTGEMTVCERGGPCQPHINLVLDIRSKSSWPVGDPLPGDHTAIVQQQRHAIAAAVRVAASLGVAWHSRQGVLKWTLLGDEQHLAQGCTCGVGARGRHQWLCGLASIPADGLPAIGSGSQAVVESETSELRLRQLASNGSTVVWVRPSADATAVEVQVLAAERKSRKRTERSHLRPRPFTGDTVSAANHDCVRIEIDRPLAGQLARFWREVADVPAVA